MTSQLERDSTKMNDAGRLKSEPCPKCGTRGPFDISYIRQWLTVAHEDAAEAERSTSARHALFWVQQSVEKLYKAYFLTGDDACYCEVVQKVSHDTLKSFLQLMERRIVNPESWPDHISRSRWEEVRSPILKPLKHLRRLVSEERHKFTLLPPSELEKIIGTLSSPEKTNEMVSEVLRVIGFRVDEIPRYQMLHARLAIKMYLLMEITWAHQSFVRYPAHPADATLSAQEAAQGHDRLRGMGFNHYSDEIGAIHFVKDLARIARETAEEMLVPTLERI